MKKAKPKSDYKSKLILDIRPLESTIERLSETPENLIEFELVFLLLEILSIAASMDFPSTWQSSTNNFRIYVYSVVMLVIGFLKRVKIDYSNMDPLAMTKWAWVIKLTDYVLQANAFYLLIRLVADIPLIHSFAIVMHCAYTSFTHIESRKRVPKFKGRSTKSLRMKIIQPHILFMFCKVVSSEFNEVALVFILFSFFNLLVFLEIGNILFFKHFLFDFCYKKLSLGEDTKRSNQKSRKLILKNILVLLALIITVENLLAVFNKLRYEVSLALLQTLLIGAYGYNHYNHYDKVQTKFQVEIDS